VQGNGPVQQFGARGADASDLVELDLLIWPRAEVTLLCSVHAHGMLVRRCQSGCPGMGRLSAGCQSRSSAVWAQSSSCLAAS
jgi:hypothetical protein